MPCTFWPTYTEFMIWPSGIAIYLVNTSDVYTELPSNTTPCTTGLVTTAKSIFTPSGTDVKTGFTSEK